jgi:prepilin-type N-terminal cleavage/methylation domain-containing protein
MVSLKTISDRVRKALQGNEGFTLVEMAIALVIMAIIIGVILLGSRTTVQNSKVTAASQQLETVKGAVISYEAVYNGYPDTIDGTTAPAIKNYLPAAPSSLYVYTCDTTNGISLAYTAADAATATAVSTEWAKQLSAANVTIGADNVTVTGVIQSGAVACATQ